MGMVMVKFEPTIEAMKLKNSMIKQKVILKFNKNKLYESTSRTQSPKNENFGIATAICVLKTHVENSDDENKNTDQIPLLFKQLLLL
ncbi:hypothetical protein EB796_020091 [Bugula neritina]|uniref:Uncharacterized protein n=1 Tax=Bugula neritina TaxID=10212 RepID=A0A7J7J6E1_BUGNE|nr:hypothetical protein EB796_020091 [Bugula neritina]